MNTTNKQKSKTNIALAGIFWGLCLLIVPLWGRGKQTEELEPSLSTSYVESPGTKMSRKNWLQFEKMAPRRNLMVGLVPEGFKHPGELTIYLSSEWKQESSTTRRHLVNQWNGMWSQVARANSQGKEQPRIHYYQTNRSIFQSPSRSTHEDQFEAVELLQQE